MLPNKKLALGLGATGVALVTGLGVTSAAYASTTTPTPTPSASASADASTGGQAAGKGGHGRGGGFGVQASALATKLGVDEAKVKAALKTFREANKPAAGSTTPGTKPDRSARDAALAASLAKSLGIDEAKVTAAIQEIRTEEQAERAAALKTRLDKAVTDGKLTQAEADGAAKAVAEGIIGGGR